MSTITTDNLDQVPRIAKVAYEANRAYCQTLGDNTQLLWADSPPWQRATVVDGVLAIMDGRVSTPEDSHENWLSRKGEEGWVYGEVKDVVKKIHPCMVSFADLPAWQRCKDVLFFSIVTAFIKEDV